MANLSGLNADALRQVIELYKQSGNPEEAIAKLLAQNNNQHNTTNVEEDKSKVNVTVNKVPLEKTEKCDESSKNFPVIVEKNKSKDLCNLNLEFVKNEDDISKTESSNFFANSNKKIEPLNDFTETKIEVKSEETIQESPFISPSKIYKICSSENVSKDNGFTQPQFTEIVKSNVHKEMPSNKPKEIEPYFDPNRVLRVKIKRLSDSKIQKYLTRGFKVKKKHSKSISKSKKHHNNNNNNDGAINKLNKIPNEKYSTIKNIEMKRNTEKHSVEIKKRTEKQNFEIKKRTEKHNLAVKKHTKMQNTEMMSKKKNVGINNKQFDTESKVKLKVSNTAEKQTISAPSSHEAQRKFEAEVRKMSQLSSIGPRKSDDKTNSLNTKLLKLSNERIPLRAREKAEVSISDWIESSFRQPLVNNNLINPDAKPVLKYEKKTPLPPVRVMDSFQLGSLMNQLRKQAKDGVDFTSPPKDYVPLVSERKPHYRSSDNNHYRHDDRNRYRRHSSPPKRPSKNHRNHPSPQSQENISPRHDGERHKRERTESGYTINQKDSTPSSRKRPHSECSERKPHDRSSDIELNRHKLSIDRLDKVAHKIPRYSKEGENKYDKHSSRNIHDRSPTDEKRNRKMSMEKSDETHIRRSEEPKHKHYQTDSHSSRNRLHHSDLRRKLSSEVPHERPRHSEKDNINHNKQIPHNRSPNLESKKLNIPLEKLSEYLKRRPAYSIEEERILKESREIFKRRGDHLSSPYDKDHISVSKTSGNHSSNSGSSTGSPIAYSSPSSYRESSSSRRSRTDTAHQNLHSPNQSSLGYELLKMNEESKRSPGEYKNIHERSNSSYERKSQHRSSNESRSATSQSDYKVDMNRRAKFEITKQTRPEDMSPSEFIKLEIEKRKRQKGVLLDPRMKKH